MGSWYVQNTFTQDVYTFVMLNMPMFWKEQTSTFLLHSFKYQQTSEKEDIATPYKKQISRFALSIDWSSIFSAA